MPNLVISAGRCQLRPSGEMSVECQWQGIIDSKNSSVQIKANTGTGPPTVRISEFVLGAEPGDICRSLSVATIR